MKKLSKKILWKYIALLLVISVSACNNSKQQALTEEEELALKPIGDSISLQMQNVLLQNVSNAIKKGGTDHAIEFCNEKAMLLTDSVSDKLNVYIQRLSDKNRNPNNAIQTPLDSLAWEQIKHDKRELVKQDIQGDIYYYKPIMMAMPTCIKCHGNNTDIAESTQKIIALKYPKDKAIGYKMGDLRGMWKIKLENKKKQII